MTSHLKKYSYLIALSVVYLCWTSYMLSTNGWSIFKDWWPMSLTMILGSMVAGATAEGGAAVAFPVFTKVLHIPATEARTFGLMIQAVGMTMAGLVIIINRIKILPKVIGCVSLGGMVGMVLGSLFVVIPGPYPKILFTFITTAFGVALIISRWVIKWTPLETSPIHSWREALFFGCIGVAGGIFAANTGSGIDTLTFILLTLAFGINEKISTPTTVIIMGINSVVGFFVRGVIIQDIGIVWEYWLACIPIVILGAPLGAWAASRVNRDTIIRLLLGLITLELVTTILLIPFTQTMLTITGLTVMLCIFAFTGMLYYRHYHLPLRPEQGLEQAKPLLQAPTS